MKRKKQTKKRSDSLTQRISTVITLLQALNVGNTGFKHSLHSRLECPEGLYPLDI